MIEGRLFIDLHRNGSGIERVEIASSRPRGVVELLVNKDPGEVIGIMRLLFSVCAMAQGRAASAAMERALGLPFCPVTEAARDALILAETAREHLVCIALNWPRFSGGKVCGTEARQIQDLPGRICSALFPGGEPFAIGARALPDREAFDEAVGLLDSHIAEIAFGEPVEKFLTRTRRRELEGWADNGESIPARLVRRVTEKGWETIGYAESGFLPRLDEDLALSRLLGDDTDAELYVARPDWAGFPCETTALSRRHDEALIADLMASCGTGLLTRLAARLVDLACIPGEMRLLAERFADAARLEAGDHKRASSGDGFAQIEAARGRLVHGVRIAEGRIARYRILAPTEWNFHPDGAAAKGLRSLTGTDDAELNEQAKLLIGAIDPCVGFEVRIH